MLLLLYSLVSTISSLGCRTSRLPVIYVFGKKPVDPVDCAKKLADSARASAAASPSGGKISCGDINEPAKEEPHMQLRVEMKIDVAYVYRAGQYLSRSFRS